MRLALVLVLVVFVGVVDINARMVGSSSSRTVRVVRVQALNAGVSYTPVLGSVRPVSNRARRRPHTSMLTVTAYCATGHRTASGRWPRIGTAAANGYPFETLLRVRGVGLVLVDDRSAPGATDVDLYLGSDGCEQRATVFGRRQLAVAVVR